MSFDIPPNGTRGARVPGGPIVRFGNKVVIRLYRATGGGIAGHKTLLLTTIGARSGVPRTAMLRRFDDGPGREVEAPDQHDLPPKPWEVRGDQFPLDEAKATLQASMTLAHDLPPRKLVSSPIIYGSSPTVLADPT